MPSVHQQQAPPSMDHAAPPLLAGSQLRRALIRATVQHGFSSPAGSLVHLSAHEGSHAGGPPARLGAELAGQLALLIRQSTGAPFVGYEGGSELSFILPGSYVAQRQLYELGQRIAATPFAAPGRAARLTPAIGYVSLGGAQSLDERIGCATAALQQARAYNDLHPVRYSAPRPALGRAPRPGPAALLGRLRRWLNTPLQVALTFVIGCLLPFCLYAALQRAGLDITPAVYLGTAFVLLVTSYLIWYEGFQALRVVRPAGEPAEHPPASAIIAAYLPNEAATVVETIRAFLRVDYPGRLELVLAYNTPHDLPVEEELRELARHEPRLRLLRVSGSGSKAQNVNAALAAVSGAFVGIFDADHHPAPDSFRRAWAWLAQGYDVVQGHCVIRNGGASWVTRMVAVEFETIYAVAHPGRARAHGFAIFGGSNGYWRTEVLRATRLRATMLTEDIDASLRALIDGRRLVYDPQLVSRELAPLTLQALWGQRMRWAQGWFQVALRHLWPALRSPRLSPRQKLGVFYLLAWREIYPWVSIQIATVMTFWAWAYGLAHLQLLIPIFVLTTLLTFSSGPGQVLFAFLLGAPEVRRNWRWYLLYLAGSILFYGGLKDLINRVSMVKELMQEKQWKVTPRGAPARLSQTGAER